jgi:hypothetical protein
MNFPQGNHKFRLKNVCERENPIEEEEEKKKNPIATKRGNVPTQRCSGKSAVFLMESALTSHGSSKSNKKPSDGRGISDYLHYLSLFNDLK